MRPAWPLALAALLAGCATTRPPPARGPPPWVEVRTAHFHLRVQLEQEAALALGRSFEEVRAAVAAFWGPTFEPDDRLDVVLFAEHASLADFVPHSVRGLLLSTTDGPWLVSTTATFGEATLQTLQAHELAHHLGRYRLLRPPHWLTEGLAQYLETLELPAGRVVFGRAPSTFSAALLTRRPVRLAALWSWQSLAVPPDDAYLFMAQSWFVVHHLVHARRGQLEALQQLLAAGVEPRRAWDEAFAGLTDVALEAELAQALTRPLPPPYSTAARAAPQQATVAALAPAEVHAIRALLQIHSTEPLRRPQWQQKIEHELQRALALDPKNERALLLRSRLIIDAADRLQFVRGIVALLPDSGRARQLLASNLGAAGEDPRPLLEEALAFEPDFAPLLDELAGYLAVDADGARAVPLAQRAVARRPWSGAWVATLAAALAASGRCTEAATAQRLSIALTGSPGEKAASTLRAYESGCSADHPVLPSR